MKNNYAIIISVYFSNVGNSFKNFRNVLYRLFVYKYINIT